MCFRVVVLKCQVPALEEDSFAEEKKSSFIFHY